MNVCVYPGSFDPVTNGHLDLIRRAAKLFDQVIVAVLCNSEKHAMFSAQERVRMIAAAAAGIGNVEVASFSGLLADFARAQGAQAIIRGVRNSADFEYERQMADVNAVLYGGAETVFLMPRAEYACISSSVVRDIARYGGDVSTFVPAAAAKALRRCAASESREESRGK